nr:PGF-pre-PGF domain-containing protein [uncultured Methanomethylovorans sp.]
MLKLLQIAGNYAYVADGDSGLSIINISNPAVPTLTHTYDTAGHAYGISVVSNYAYIADGNNGLVIANISNPASPTSMGSYATYDAQNIVVSGNYAYIADDSHGLVIIDITNPASPVFEDSYNTAGYGYGVTISGSYVYVADFDNGLVILHVDTVPDTTAPSSVTGLNEASVGSSWIYWTWTNPTDEDFNYATIYVDGAFITNTSAGYYNLTGLSEGTTHIISTKTVDTSGNINSTWVNDSASTISPTDIVPPASVTNLGEADVNSDWIRWTWTNPDDADFSHVIVYLNGTFIANTTDSSISYYNATGLSEGATYTIGIQTVDYSGNINSTTVNDSAITRNYPVVSGLSGTNITKTSITLTWEASADTTRVQISRNDVVIGNVTGATSYVDAGLTSSTTYGYTLTPYNQDGLAGESVSVSLRTRSSSSGGSSGGSSRSTSSGGSGGSASVEDFANLVTKDVATIYLRINTTATYQFTKEGNPIQSISFYSLKNSGETVSTVEVLNNRSKLVNSTPEGSIYQYVNMWVGKASFATASNIKDASVRFKVNSSWIQQMGVSPSDVKLQRYNGNAWEVLPTTIVSNTTDYVVFESQTPGFSPFAITGEKVVTIASNENVKSSNENEVPVSNITQTEDDQKEETQSSSSMWMIIAVILVIGFAIVGYAYSKKEK